MADRNIELLSGMAHAQVRQHVALLFQTVIEHRDFANAMPGIVSQSSRSGLVLQRFAHIAQLSTP